MNLLGQSLATALFSSSAEMTKLRSVPSPSDTRNTVLPPCINKIQDRSCQRILPCVWTVGTPYSSDLTSETRPEMTAEYTILSFPLDNMTGCPAFPTKYLQNNLIILWRKCWGFVRGKSIQQRKITLHLTSQPGDFRSKKCQYSYTFMCTWLRYVTK